GSDERDADPLAVPRRPRRRVPPQAPGARPLARPPLLAAAGPRRPRSARRAVRRGAVPRGHPEGLGLLEHPELAHVQGARVGELPPVVHSLDDARAPRAALPDRRRPPHAPGGREAARPPPDDVGGRGPLPPLPLGVRPLPRDAALLGGAPRRRRVVAPREARGRERA